MIKKTQKSGLGQFIKHYATHRPLFYCLIRPQEAVLFKRYSPRIHPILDFGCGDGFFAQTVFGKKNIDIGLDLENSRAKEAESKEIYKKVVFYDGNRIPFADNFFQTIISNCVLEHVVNLNTALDEVSRVLKPGGLFVASVMTNNWNRYLFGSKIFGSTYIDWMRRQQVHHNLFSHQKWVKLFNRYGLVVEVEKGYLSSQNSLWLDIFHYISIPLLILKKGLGKWPMGSAVVNSSRLRRFISSKINLAVPAEQSAALFFVLKKTQQTAN